MKRIVTAIAVAAIALAGTVQARATTFPALTTIYVASGILDNSTQANLGIATAVSCTNMSGQTASVRFQFRHSSGGIIAGATLLFANLVTRTVTTEGNIQYLNAIQIPTSVFLGGSLQILSTQSAIFCSAWLVHAGGNQTGPAGVDLHMVRFNPHPGTVE